MGVIKILIKMGGQNSIPNYAFRVISIAENSPISQISNIWPYFDVIIAANSHVLDTDDGTLASIIRSHCNKSLQLNIYNIITKETREVNVKPSRDWGGEGLLGAKVRYDKISPPEERIIRILDVFMKGPANKAGLEP